MSDFGDFEPGDAFDTDAPDPVAVARIFYELRRDQANGDEQWPLFHELHPWEQALVVYTFRRLLNRLRREGGF